MEGLSCNIVVQDPGLQTYHAVPYPLIHACSIHTDEGWGNVRRLLGQTAALARTALPSASREWCVDPPRPKAE
jgi:hypothetical protein